MSEIVTVVFRKWKDSGDILALFPEITANPAGQVLSYQHIGQHGAADYQHCIHQTVKATEIESEPLKDELTRIGYNLVVRERR